MIGIVESGSTKTQWCFVNEENKKFLNRTLGFNPYYQSVDEIYQTLKNDLLPHIQFSEKVEKIYYYGASCEDEANRLKVREAFRLAMPATKVEVMHDLLGAAKSLFGDKPGIACISGTGSNSCYYDGQDVAENVHSLGLFLGDEGSGSYKGKLFVRQYIRKGLPAHIAKAFEEEYPDRTDDILMKVYSGSMPSRYLASFAPFLLKFIHEPFIYGLVYQSFEELFDNCILRYQQQDLPIGFVGSIAYHFRDVLEKVASDKKRKIALIEPDPSKALVLYHIQKEFNKV